MKAHFFLDAGANNIISGSQAAVFIHKVFRHQEQRHTSAARWRPFDPCQHKMYDIRRQIVLAG